MRAAAFDVPAVVIGGGLNALGVVRSLGSAGVPVILVAGSGKGLAMASTYARQRVVSTVDGPDLIDTLVALGRATQVKPVLFLTEEKTVRTVSEHRDTVSDLFRMQLPTHETLMALMHKQGFQDLAELHGALLPRCVNLRSRGDLPALQRLKFPCVLKPGKKDYQYGARFKKGYVVETPEEVEHLYAEISEVLADMVVQEWIEGDDSDIYFCLQYIGGNGKAVASFPGRKIRSWPPKVGGTASCTAAWEHADALHRVTQDFFAKVGFVGMGSMEYKRDRRDGRFYMIEPTVARTDFQQEVATIHGVNVPLAAYFHETGASPALARRPIHPKCIVWREPQTDGWSIELQGEQREFCGYPVRNAYWHYSDPGPWLGWVMRRFTARAGGLRRRILGAR